MEELIAVRDIAVLLRKRKQHLFKVLKRLEIDTKKRRAVDGRNQLVAYITQEEYLRLRIELESRVNSEVFEGFVEAGVNDVGVFYLIQLEPEYDPGRFKVGFTVDIAERLRHLRCSAPFANVLQTWPCRPVWERTAIESVSVGYERLHTEVFRATSLEEVAVRCDRFFSVMPSLQSNRSDHTNGLTPPDPVSGSSSV